MLRCRHHCDWPIVLEIETPSAERTAQSKDGTGNRLLRNDDISPQGEGTVEQGRGLS